MVGAAEAVIAIDKEPKPAALAEVPIAEGDVEVFALHGQIDHGRVFAAAVATGPEHAVADFAVLVGDRGEEAFRIEGTVEGLF